MEAKLEKKDLLKSWLIWIHFGQQCYNYEIMQGMGFCHSMNPIVKKLYPEDPEKRGEAINRHLTYYNTENNWGAAVGGITASLEEGMANGENVTGPVIQNIKTALMGPLAGIGDTITQSLVKTITLGIACEMALRGSVFGPILFFLVMSAYCFFISNRAFFIGYRTGRNSVTKLLGSGKVALVTEALGALSMMVVGFLVANNIGIGIPLVIKYGKISVQIQDVLDKIMPKLLPLLIFFGIFALINKGMKPARIILIIFVVGIVGSLLKILA